jgi:hypothetical protein
MKRIIYKKLNDNQYISKEPIDTPTGKVLASFDLSAKSFALMDFSSNEIIVRGVGTSRHKILIKIKAALTTLGAKFITEKRYSNIVLPEE